ncbi:unnamed protein product [Durusdinium trenchii]
MPVPLYPAPSFFHACGHFEVGGLFTTEAFQGLSLDTPRSESHHGKGGHAQFESGCRRYVIKSLSKDDNKTLLRIAGPLIERMLSGSTMLCPIYMHFKDIATGQYFMAMRNLTEMGPWCAKYDLKGCDDDKTLEVKGRVIRPVRKRFYRPHMWCACMWSSERWEYYQGKLRSHGPRLGLAAPVREEAVKQIASDADWLISQNIMDYSLLIAIRRLPPEVAKSCGAGPLPVAASTCAPGVHRWAMLDKASGELVVLHMGIIDFLQPWTTSKVAAMYIKSFEFNKATVPPPLYGRRPQPTSDWTAVYVNFGVGSSNIKHCVGQWQPCITNHQITILVKKDRKNKKQMNMQKQRNLLCFYICCVFCFFLVPLLHL